MIRLDHAPFLVGARSDAKPVATFADRARAGRFVLDVGQTARLIRSYIRNVDQKTQGKDSTWHVLRW
jgi:hypothetical protein